MLAAVPLWETLGGVTEILNAPFCHRIISYYSTTASVIKL